jgi:uncharacterized protein
MKKNRSKVTHSRNFQAFRHPAVRDLVWAVFSAPLLARLPDFDGELVAPRLESRDWQWLEALDKNPAPLIAALAASPSNRLGLYFESLWRFYLEQHPDWTVLAHNLQVQNLEEEGRTLGAFDFLCARGDEFWHLELAVKFYLGLPGTGEMSQWNQWLGPNANDRLDIKLGRLTSHQLPLSQSPRGRSMLSQLVGREAPWRRSLILKGYFFYPGGSLLSAPNHASVHHLRGSWWHLERFLPQLDSGHWISLRRKEWLSFAQLGACDEPMTGQVMGKLLNKAVGEAGRPVLLAKMQQRGQGWHEQERIFVVPDYWPRTAKP